MAIVGHGTWGGLFVGLLLLTHSVWETVFVSVCVCVYVVRNMGRGDLGYCVPSAR